MEKTGYGLVITGISGGGKTTVAAEIKKRHPHLSQGLRMTVRKPRPGEIHGVHYEFLNEDELRNLHKQGELLYFEEWYGSMYAMRKKPVYEKLSNGEHILIETIVPAAFKLHREPNMRVVFLVTKDDETMIKRLKNRGEEEKEIQERLKYAQIERKMGQDLGVFTIINDDLENTIKEVEKFFLS